MTIPMFTEFTLPVLEARYRASIDLPPSSSRDLAAWEYITALETALHGSSMGKVYGLNPAVATRGVA